MVIIEDGFRYFKDVLEENSTVADNKYFFIPYWFEKIPNTDTYIKHHLELLPEDLKDIITDKRNKVVKIPKHLKNNDL